MGFPSILSNVVKMAVENCRGKENLMAYLQSRKNKEGQVVSYSIRVYKGRDPRTGKQLTPYTMTWHVPGLERKARPKGSGKAGGGV